MALLGELQRMLENTYARRTGVNLERCVVGPQRCAELACSAGWHAEMSAAARFVFYIRVGDLRLALF